MQGSLATLLLLLFCASAWAQARSSAAVPLPACTTCSCPELESLGHAVLTACAAPAVAALPQMAAACALAHTLPLGGAQVMNPALQRPVATNKSPAMDSKASKGTGPAGAPAPALVPPSLAASFPHARSEHRRLPSNYQLSTARHHATATVLQKQRHRRAGSGACASHSVLALLQAHCVVPGCAWLSAASEASSLSIDSWFQKDVTLRCSDATRVNVPLNHTMCPALAQPCTVALQLNLRNGPVYDKSLQKGALLAGIWQHSAAVILRGQWGTQGIIAVLQHAHNITELDAMSTGLSSLSRHTLVPFTSLRTLALNKNNIRSIDADAFSDLTALESLSLSDNMLTTLPLQLFNQCPRLFSLELHGNRLSNIDSTVFHGLSALKCLNLAENQLTHLPDGLFHSLSSLRKLVLEQNKLMDLDTMSFQGLSALELLNLGTNQLAHLPRGVFQGLSALGWLFVDHNDLAHVDASIFDGLVALEGLFLDFNQLTRVPSDLDQMLPLLSLFGIGYNKLVDIDATVFQGLTTLEWLVLGANQLTRLSEGVFDSLSRLTRLHVDHNNLADFDATSILRMLTALKVLDLSGNPFSRLPGGLLSLPPHLSSLSELWLESTEISKVQLPILSQLSYLTLKDSRRLTSVVVASGSRIPALDVTGTALRMSDLPCESLGYQALVARRMQRISGLDLLRKCIGKERLFLDMSNNGEHRLEAVQQSLAQLASNLLVTDQSLILYPSLEPVRDQIVVVTMVGSPVQCSVDTKEHFVAVNGSYGHLVTPQQLQMYTCICVPGYFEKHGVCRKVVPFVATPGGITTIVFLVIMVVLVIGYGPIKRRLHRDRHDLELQRGLLEYAETEVLALKRAWEIEAGDVTLVERIDGDSEGAFGTVWRGDWDGMAVAVKVLRDGLLEMDSRLADEFDREAEFLMRARHTNVVRFFGAGRMPGGEPFVVLELVARGSLRGLLRGSRASMLDWKLKQRLALDVARGMAYIHSLGALHRDLKSGNVLVTENWRGKVADFGSMRKLLETAAVESSSRAGGAANQYSDPTHGRPSDARVMTLTAGVGTPLYMAPEVLRGDVYGEAADVWAFGVMVWELVEQRTPDLLVETGDKSRGPFLGRLLELLERGERLQLAAGAPLWAQRITTGCLATQASERPTFVVLMDRLVADPGEGTESME